MNFAKKMDAFSSSIFVQLEQACKKVTAIELIDLSVGTPDKPPAQHIMNAMQQSLTELDSYKYAIQDYPKLLDAAQNWYKSRYNVEIATTEICGLIGSQDGLCHLPLTLLNPGDVALVPNPGYPMFRTGPVLSSAQIYDTPLNEQNDYLPDLEAIPSDVAHRAKMFTISYPANPIGRLAPIEFFEKCVSFAKKYDIVILHDNAYSDLVFDGKRGGSFLNAKGACDVGVEFNSLSKSYNLTGARISFALGNADIISTLSKMKSNIDYGIFRPVQRAAIAALTGSQQCVLQQANIYQNRRDVLIDALGKNGWNIKKPEGTMFVWAKLPIGYKNSMDFVLKLLEKTGVVLVPGIAFGSLGEGYVRFGLTKDEVLITEAAKRIGEFLS